MKLPRSDYFQGILQLRDVSDEVVAFVNNQIKKRGDVAVTRTVRLSNGVDLYVTSQKFIRILGKKLRESFGGEIRTSARLHTKNRQGKDLYRINLLFRPSTHKKGDVVSVRGENVKIIRIGRKIFARDLKTGKKRTIRSVDLGT